MDRSVLATDETFTAIIKNTRIGNQDLEEKLLDLLISRGATCASRIKTLLEADPNILAPLGLRAVSNGLLKKEVTAITTQRIPAAISTNNVAEVLRLFSILDVNPATQGCVSVQDLARLPVQSFGAWASNFEAFLDIYRAQQPGQPFATQPIPQQPGQPFAAQPIPQQPAQPFAAQPFATQPIPQQVQPLEQQQQQLASFAPFHVASAAPTWQYNATEAAKPDTPGSRFDKEHPSVYDSEYENDSKPRTAANTQQPTPYQQPAYSATSGTGASGQLAMTEASLRVLPTVPFAQITSQPPRPASAQPATTPAIPAPAPALAGPRTSTPPLSTTPPRVSSSSVTPSTSKSTLAPLQASDAQLISSVEEQICLALESKWAAHDERMVKLTDDSKIALAALQQRLDAEFKAESVRLYRERADLIQQADHEERMFEREKRVMQQEQALLAGGLIEIKGCVQVVHVPVSIAEQFTARYQRGAKQVEIPKIPLDLLYAIIEYLRDNRCVSGILKYAALWGQAKVSQAFTDLGIKAACPVV